MQLFFDFLSLWVYNPIVMSAEAPRNTGITAPVTPQESQGGLHRFLRRFFVPQPQSGLENFATRLHQREDSYLALQRQQDTLGRSIEASSMVINATFRAEALQTHTEREEQFRARGREALKILQDFQISKRLRYIRGTVLWGGKGKIGPIEERLATFSGSDYISTVGGLELVHQYPGCHQISVTTCYGGEMDTTIEKFVSDTRFTKLAIKVIHIEHDSGESEYALRILSGVESSSSNYNILYPSNILEMDIPIKAKDSIALLDQSLIKEIDQRLNRGLSPKQLERKAWEELIAAGMA